MDVALHYTAKNLRETGHNPKPVLYHSFKVANKLYEYNYSESVVIASVLHDLIEDTDITYNEIEKEFGKNIADLVQAVSFDPKIDDKLEQAKLMFENSLKYGMNAVLIKCSDLIDNIDFVQFVDDKEKRTVLLKKYELFLEMTKDMIGTTGIFNELESKVIAFQD